MSTDPSAVSAARHGSLDEDDAVQQQGCTINVEAPAAPATPTSCGGTRSASLSANQTLAAPRAR
jgi:hypothetical protein